jgi:hypothetical protein
MGIDLRFMIVGALHRCDAFQPFMRKGDDVHGKLLIHGKVPLDVSGAATGADVAWRDAVEDVTNSVEPAHARGAIDGASRALVFITDLVDRPGHFIL